MPGEQNHLPSDEKSLALPQDRRGPGQPPTVNGMQFDSLTAVVGPDWIAASKRPEKSKTLGVGLNYCMAKYGLLDPWRKLDVDVPEPPTPYTGVAGGTGNLSQEEIAALQVKMKKVSHHLCSLVDV